MDNNKQFVPPKMVPLYLNNNQSEFTQRHTNNNGIHIKGHPELDSVIGGDERITQVFKTYNYNKFNKMTGNRDIESKRIAKIKESIDTVGQVINPIIVNEKFEVIDGQGRLETFKLLQLPVYYIVVPGIGMKECVSMNINQTNWTLPDYIKSFADMNNESYIRLSKLLNTFLGGKITLNVVDCAVSGSLRANSRTIKSGAYICEEIQYENAKKDISRS